MPSASAQSRPWSLKTLVVDPRDGDWSWRRAAIARFLGLALVAEPSLAPGELGEVRESTVSVTVSVKDGHLIIDGLLWPGNSLRWKGDNVFDAESWPLEVVFESVA